MTINVIKLEEIVKDSLFREEEVRGLAGKIPDDAKLGDGIIRIWGFHFERLKSHQVEIEEMLSQLSDNFMKTKGGGWSFLNMPFDKEGHQWGEQPTAAYLVALGNALGLITFPLPKEMWPDLPGGVPYIVILDDRFTNLVVGI